MKKFFRKLTSLLLSALMVCSIVTTAAVSVYAAEVGVEESVGVSSGTTGDCTWRRDSNGVLTISGNGVMENYSYKNLSGKYITTAPWGTNITSVIIENGVTSIGNYAFYTTGLTSVTIPDSVTSIGINAFYNCTGLTSVTIPDSVTSIGINAFYNCTGLTSVTIPDSVTNIGERAFYNCKGLTSVTIPDNVVKIGKSAFDETAWYNNQPPGLFYAGKLAYKYKGTMPSNTSIVLLDGTKGIVDSAFYNCTGLTSVTIPDSVTNIGEYAFYGCTGLTNIIGANGVTSVGGSSFYRCPAAIALGSTGDCRWKCIGSELTISGNGAMEYYSYDPDFDSNAPWGTSITSVVIENGVTNIGDCAFYNCNGLTSVTIPDSVTSIGYDAFSGCTGLASVTIPDSVTNIGEHAFSGCTGLTSIDIPDSVRNVDGYAFSGCTSLTSVTIGNSVRAINYYTFYNCTGLTSVTIPDSVTSIGECAFSGCTGLASVNISNIAAWCNISFSDYNSNPLYFAHNLYLNNELVTGLVIPDGVTSIGSYAFSGCTGLTSVTIPDSVTGIGSYAFYNCTGLKSIIIPDSVNIINYYALGYSEDYGKAEDLIIYGFTYNEAYYYAKNNDFEFVSMGESQNSMLPVTGITGECSWELDKNGTLTVSGNGNMGNYYYGLGAFFPPWENYKHYIYSGIIENGVKNIGGCTFGGCDYLSSVSIADSVTNIGDQAFYGCYNLKSICIPNSVTNIGNQAFLSCSRLEKISIPDSVKKIGNYAFSNCYKLKSIAIPDSVTSIGDNAFSNCSKDFQIICVPGSYTETYAKNNRIKSCNYGFEYYILEDGTVEITNYYGNEINVIIPDCIFSRSVTSIKKWLFANNTDIQSVTIPNTVSTIQQGAFYNCTELKTVTMGNNVTEIGLSAFEKCVQLESINLSNQLETIGDEAFYDCRRLKKLNIPATVTIIGDEAFTNCRSLTSLTIPEGVKTLGSEESVGFGMFENCKNLSEITIPASVNFIQGNAFEGCQNVTIVGNVGTYAQSFAQSNQIAFRMIDDVKLGDTNGDGRVCINDVTVIQRYLAELESLEGVYLYAADANRDGVLNISDATTLQLFLAEYEVPYPIGEKIKQ